jgi:hypothetical protein
VQDEPCEDNHRDGARAPTGGRGRGEPIC